MTRAQVEPVRLHFFHTNAAYLTGLRLPMLDALVRAGYRVSAFAPNMDQPTARRLADHGIEGRAYGMDAAGISPLRDIVDTWRIARMLRREAPDVVFSNNIKPVVFVTVAATLAGVRRRHALVGGLGYAFTDVPGTRLPVSRRLTRWIASTLYALAFRLSSRVIFHNPDDRDLLVRRRVCPADRAAVVAGSGVDVDAFAPEDRPTDPTFVFVGRLLADKGVREYLEAAAATKRRYPLARFLLVGEADANPSAIDAREVERLVQAGVVEWKGKVADVRPHLHESSVFVLPSYREGVPRSTLEAMACGLAVVTTDAPGCRETVVHGHNGLIVPVGDAQALAGALAELCDDPARIPTMGDNGRAMAVERFSSDRVNHDILNLIQGAA
jgi:glycosyltransferase involved in cell wall biosynthesis